MNKVNKEPSDNTASTHRHLVYVYGTLRKDQWNHYLLNTSQFIGFAKTKEKYALFGSGIPFLSRTTAISQITGEVYSVDDATLRRLDELEGHPDFYERALAEVLLQDGTAVEAWIYFHDTVRGDLIESGDFLRQAPVRRR